MTRDQMPDGTVLERADNGEILGVFLDESEPVDVLEHRQRARQPVQAGPRCAIPRPAPRPPAGPPIEPPVTRVSDATWAQWGSERQRRIDARSAPRRDNRQRVVDALELGAGYIERDTVGAVCPLCRGPLAVSFHGETVTLRCCAPAPDVAPCAEDDVTRAVFGEGVAS